jgi:signal transduction histidine kinase
VNDTGCTLMENGFVLYRWFRDISIARKLYFTVGTMALLIAVELFVLFFALGTLSSLRAYVGGEGLWSKAQKDAVFHLYKYGVTGTESDYDLFEQFMHVPIGDAKARRELLRNDRNLDVARVGFLEGRNHPDDIDGMINLFLHFSNVFYIKKAISVWGDAQAIAMQLPPIADRLRREKNLPNPSQETINELLASIYMINEKLTAYEDEFSFTLGEGSRWLERVVLKLLFTTALTVEATGLLLAISVCRGIRKGLTEVIRSANSFSAGHLDARAKVLSRDEMGVVAGAFNEMAENLQTRVREFAKVNQRLGHEIDERKHAETELKGAFAQLQATLHELKRETAERLRTEEMLHQSAKMKALGQLTGGMAHDFNNLLGVIIGNVEFLLDAVKGTPEHVELTRDILKSALSGSQLTRRLMAIGRTQLLQPQCVDVNELLANHVEMLRRILGAAINIKVTKALNPWFTVADPSQIEQVLLNLALNARDAMPQGGYLTLEATNVHLDAQSTAWSSAEIDDGDYVMLSVTDTGTGMPDEVVERAIEPFFTTKSPSSGSGLGLSMAYGFAKQSGGHLVIESVVGVGTTVKLYLPRVREGAATMLIATKDHVPDPRGTETILLVDDNQTLLTVARRHIDALGYKVLSAAGGSAALDILMTDATVDLLFTDLVMPEGMSGFELAEAARHLRPDLKVLFTSGYAAGLREHDECTLLSKPYNRHELARALRSSLDTLVGRAN